MSWWWSWLLVTIGITGFFLTSRGHYLVGWGLNISVQVLWIIYAIVSRQLGFIVSAFFYGTVFFLNLRREVRRADQRLDEVE